MPTPINSIFQAKSVASTISKILARNITENYPRYFETIVEETLNDLEEFKDELDRWANSQSATFDKLRNPNNHYRKIYDTLRDMAVTDYGVIW